MIQHLLPPDLVTCNSVSSTCEKGVRQQHALALLEGLRKTACYINAGHYPCSVLNGWASRQAYWAAANKCF